MAACIALFLTMWDIDRSDVLVGVLMSAWAPTHYYPEVTVSSRALQQMTEVLIYT